MTYIAPEAVTTVAAFRNKAVNVGIPFEIPAKGMEDHDKAGGKAQGFILFEKEAGDNAVYCMEKTVKEWAVIEKENAEMIINGEYTVPMEDINQLKGRTETAVAAKRNKFEFSTVRTSVHGAAKRGIAAA